ncbi:hypothetical protein Cob_v010676 [Colletotrichum orbiculare MAFF 240422]|uniref:C2H2-type domain-containing protein n=1 Tax=Colletotrichum orbiculare (strain 104-T / ATCC 96160 / CBS 514.97 / LARS 414 / MAFF 240422) TaxID=1213857 RepID=A0A484FFU5_COLOR|nr:hypothetical protein Cob_v010676 [Colletotrichum orbiculare MAFF 240422]
MCVSQLARCLSPCLGLRPTHSTLGLFRSDPRNQPDTMVSGRREGLRAGAQDPVLCVSDGDGEGLVTFDIDISVSLRETSADNVSWNGQYALDLNETIDPALLQMQPTPGGMIAVEVSGFEEDEVVVSEVASDASLQSSDSSVCDARFSRPCDLKRHVRIRHEPQVSCPVRGCILKFPFNKDMYRHVRNRHTSYAANPRNGIPRDGGACPYAGCLNRCTRRDNLKRHIDEKHKDKRRAQRVER